MLLELRMVFLEYLATDLDGGCVVLVELMMLEELSTYVFFTSCQHIWLGMTLVLGIVTVGYLLCQY